LRLGYLICGVAILFTTELGVLDGAARISTDIIKVNYLRDSQAWSSSRLYFTFLWCEILMGTTVLLFFSNEPVMLFNISAAINGAVMFLYSLTLLYMNNKILSRSLSMSPLRFVMLVWACSFFGYFTIQALRLSVIPMITG
jgi:hypothetical protein